MAKTLIDIYGPEGEKKRIVADELQVAALPLLAYLNKFFDPYTYAVVSEGKVEIVSTQTVRPLPIRD